MELPIWLEIGNTMSIGEDKDENFGIRTEDETHRCSFLLDTKQINMTMFYPDIGSLYDLWYVRLSGHGLGNSFFSYFHAFVLSRLYSGRIISPPWFSLKSGPLLRGDATKRFYWSAFRPPDDEIHGFRKFIVLSANYHSHHYVTVGGGQPPDVAEGRLNIVKCDPFSFVGLHEHRDAIRARIGEMAKDVSASSLSWGEGRYIGVHVRMGDFQETDDPAVIRSATNTRIPLAWYMNVVSGLKQLHPNLPILVFSDSNDAELQPLLEQGTRIFRSGSDVADLLKLASSSILVGSNSTFSHWAAFLGDMPSIWLERDRPFERPTSASQSIEYVPL